MDTKLYQRKLGQVIREKRQRLDLSQEKFAEVVELHRTYIGGIERGERNVSLRNLLRIADALSTPLSELLARTEHEVHSSQ